MRYSGQNEWRDVSEMWVRLESWVCLFVGRIGIIVMMLNNCDLWSRTYPWSPLFLIIRLWLKSAKDECLPVINQRIKAKEKYCLLKRYYYPVAVEGWSWLGVWVRWLKKWRAGVELGLVLSRNFLEPAVLWCVFTWSKSKWCSRWTIVLISLTLCCHHQEKNILEFKDRSQLVKLTIQAL